jgi:hypothetical protein
MSLFSPPKENQGMKRTVTALFRDEYMKTFEIGRGKQLIRDEVINESVESPRKAFK